MIPPHRNPGCERGSAAVEFALVLPVLLIVLLGTMDIARLTWTMVTLDFAVSSAARCAAINTAACGSTSQIQAYAAMKAYGMTVPASKFSVNGAATCGNQVNVSTSFDFVSPWILPNLVTVTANACYPTQPTG